MDYELCESNALCMDSAPEVFEVGEDDLLTVLQDCPDETLRSKVLAALNRCPKRAISVTET